jgi:signal transduction histidine kinase
MQVTTPAAVIGLLLLGVCLVSAWFINRLQTDLANILQDNVASLRAAQQLEITVRQLRFNNFLFLIAPGERPKERIQADQRRFEEWLGKTRQVAHTDQERDLVRQIEEGYQHYRQEFEDLCAEMVPGRPWADYQALADDLPVRRIVEPCRSLLEINEDMMEATEQESKRLSQWLRLPMLLLGLGAPISGLLAGYGIARGLSRSIYQLSVRVQDVAQRLEQDVGPVSIAADGDIGQLDQRLQHVVERVGEVVEQLQQHQRKALRAQQLAAVGQLAASVAHEVRNPLTAIKMLIEAALRPNNCKPLRRDDLDVIHGEAARLEQIVQGLLDFARPPAPQHSRCDLRDVVAQAVELVGARARQQAVAVQTRCPDQPVPARADPGQLRTVLVNLFLNALDAMPQGGRLEVELGARRRTGVRVSVTDTGSGIAPVMLDRLFTPFASTKPTGTGLGLSICRRIVEEHGGQITAANRPEGGACFTITLPAPLPEDSHADSPGH